MPSVDAEYDKNAVVTIQGGGVFGFNLLGQLQSVLDQGIQPVALAGTSAGSVVATLHWAGYSPRQILDVFRARAGRANGLTDLVGPFDGGVLFDFLGFLRWSERLERYLSWVRQRVAPGGEARPLRSALLRHFCLIPAYCLAAPAYLPDWRRVAADFALFNRSVGSRGLFSGAAFEEEIDRLLRDSPRLDGIDKAHPRIVGGRRELLTFGQARDWTVEHGRPALLPLMLAATELRSRRLELFDSTEADYDDMPVARAVRASAGFPFFFRPVDVARPAGAPNRYESFVDGGVICNFPAFVFAESFRRRMLRLPDYNAAATRPWVHIGLRLTDGERPHVAKELHSPSAFLKAVWSLATGAARSDLEGRLAGTLSRSISVEMPFAETNGPAGVLDIQKMDPEMISVMFNCGRRAADRELAPLQFRPPDTELIEPELKSLVAQAKGANADLPGLRFRANVFIPEGIDLVPRYWAGMDSPADTDRDMRLRFDCGLTGFCFTRRRPVICNLKRFEAVYNAGGRVEGRPINVKELFGFTPTLQAKVRPDRTWLLSVPIFDPLASYPYELGANPEAGTEHLHFAELPSVFDGAVFGVLNLDANFDYGAGEMPDDPNAQAADPRFLALINIAIATSLRLAPILAAGFATRPA